MRLVLFLGAGFSKPFGFPLMREFSMFSQDLPGYEEHILCLHACIEYVQRTLAYIQDDIYNVEYLMSILSMAAITNPQQTFRIGKKKVTISAAVRTLKELIWRVYTKFNIDPRFISEGSIQHFTRALQMLYKNEKGNEIDIVTTNYDLLPEMLMLAIDKLPGPPEQSEELKIPATRALPSYAILNKTKDIYQNGSRQNLHKLHGSVNWLVHKSSSKKIYCYRHAYEVTGAARLNFIPYLALEEKTFLPEGYAPIIIPPSMLKEYKIPVITKSWQRASQAIAEADHIVFIGYSFPPSDVVMKYFLGTSLANNRSGCRISIIDKNTQTVMESLQSIFVDNIWRKKVVQIPSAFENLISKDGPFKMFAEFRFFLKG